MSHTECHWSAKQVESLMDIAAVLGECMSSPECSRRVPSLLARALDLEQASLAVIRHSADDVEPHLLLCATSSKAVGDAADLELRMGAAYRYARTVDDETWANGPMFLDEAFGAVSPSLGQSRAILYARTVDAAHFLLLIVQPRSPELPLLMRQNLALITQELAKQYHCLISWQNSPQALGEPFSHLTEREWVVLRGLNSDVGEKELAGRLGLSPHTLHSHIKSIYRKIGVQGRLALLRKFQCALRNVRLRALGGEAWAERSRSSEVTVREGVRSICAEGTSAQQPLYRLAGRARETSAGNAEIPQLCERKSFCGNR